MEPVFLPTFKAQRNAILELVSNHPDSFITKKLSSKTIAFVRTTSDSQINTIFIFPDHATYFTVQIEIINQSRNASFPSLSYSETDSNEKDFFEDSDNKDYFAAVNNYLSRHIRGRFENIIPNVCPIKCNLIFENNFIPVLGKTREQFLTWCELTSDATPESPMWPPETEVKPEVPEIKKPLFSNS